jgi:hypothetical protein
MIKHIKLILQIIATHFDLLLETKVDLCRAQPLHRCGIDGLWVARP